MVPRTELVERLLGSHATPIVAVVAPAGYGKTTLLARVGRQAAPRRVGVPRPAGQRPDRAPHLHRRRARPRGTAAAECVPVAGVPGRGRRGSGPVDLGDRQDGRPGACWCSTKPRRSPIRASLDMIAELSMRLPEGSQLAIGSRRDVPVPVARLRAQRGVVEVGIDHLAMDRPAARSLLAGAGVAGLSDPEVDHLVRRTEGWPAGLYLASLAINAGSSHLAVTSTFTGDDRFMADYLRSEFLDRVSRADVSFLTRTSILDRMTGPLCDATVGRTGSSRVLRRLEQRNLLVLPLDRRSCVVPLPPPLPRAAARGAGAARARDDHGAPHPSSLVVRGQRHARGGHRPWTERR